MVKSNKKKIITLIIIFLIIFLFSIIFAIINMSNSTILNGISIDGIDVSNMTKDEATQVLSTIIENKLKSNIKVYYDEDNIETEIEPSTLEINYDINTAVNDAYNIGRTGNIFQNNYNILKLYFNKQNIKLNMSIEEKNISKVIDDISSNLPNKLIQTSYYIENKNLIITKGKEGNILKEDELKENLLKLLKDITEYNQEIIVPFEKIKPDEIDIDSIYNEIYKEPKDAYYEKEPFKVYKEVDGVKFDLDKAKELIEKNPKKSEYTIKLKYTKAKTTLEDLDINIFHDLLAGYTTRYNELNKDRTNNLRLATSKINGTILSPGEEFSYNKIVGQRSIAAGYKEAKIYTNGSVVDGLGGGICQISSTLYNAVVGANLEVTERHNHQFATSYVKPGYDATVAYGSKDFKFVNNRTYPIKIVTSVNSGIASVEIYGIKEENEYNIYIDTEVVSTKNFKTVYENDKSLEEGQEKVKQQGSNGQVVKSYKVVQKNGIIVSRDLISQDTYNALDKIILRNKSKTDN